MDRRAVIYIKAVNDTDCDEYIISHTDFYELMYRTGGIEGKHKITYMDDELEFTQCVLSSKCHPGWEFVSLDDMIKRSLVSSGKTDRLKTELLNLVKKVFTLC